MSNFFVSTSIAYVNWKPHLWFAMESIVADVIARFKRLEWYEVFFLTWTDEHGIKIYKTAQAIDITALELCDMNSEKFKHLWNLLNLTNDDFIRTSDKQRHWPSVQWIWQKLHNSWDIYLKHYEWLYCEWCECFMWDKDLVDGQCPNHKKEHTKISEENYFFKLSKYSDKILSLINSNKIEIIPHFRKNEILSMLKWEWLKDVSFSRPAKSLPWWVPVPWDKSQNMYVWCDALTNYISALDAKNDSEQFTKYWKNSNKVHCIWKDIVRFHAWIWIWMLLSAWIELPNFIHIHWFLTSQWQKMSKSLWNVVDPVEIVEKYWLDSLRYYLLREVPTWRDADFNTKQFEQLHNAHLVNWLWNLVNRVIVMSNKHWINPGWSKSKDFEEVITNTWKNTIHIFKKLDTHAWLLEIWKLVDFWNKKMDELKPWIIVKENKESFELVMKDFLELIRHIAYLIESYLPDSANKIFQILNISKSNDIKEIQAINWQDEKWEKLEGAKLLFEKIE